MDGESEGLVLPETDLEWVPSTDPGRELERVEAIVAELWDAAIAGRYVERTSVSANHVQYTLPSFFVKPSVQASTVAHWSICFSPMITQPSPVWDLGSTSWQQKM